MVSRGFIAFAACVLVGLFFMGSTGRGESVVYTNEDIEKYRKPSDKIARDAKAPVARELKEQAKGAESQKEKDYWCKKATAYRKGIEEAGDNVKEAENKLSGLKPKDKKKISQAQKNLERARKELRMRERDLSDLEEEAHRKGIPPGWLRCQFSW